MITNHATLLLIIIYASLGTALFTLPSAVNAAPTLKDAKTTFQEAGQGAYGENPPSLQMSVANVIRAALGILGILFVSLTVYGGVLWMTAGGDDKQVTKAKETLQSAVIGVVVIMISYAITEFVLRTLVTAAGG